MRTRSPDQKVGKSDPSFVKHSPRWIVLERRRAFFGDDFSTSTVLGVDVETLLMQSLDHRGFDRLCYAVQKSLR